MRPGNPFGPRDFMDPGHGAAGAGPACSPRYPFLDFPAWEASHEAGPAGGEGAARGGGGAVSCAGNGATGAGSAGGKGAARGGGGAVPYAGRGATVAGPAGGRGAGFLAGEGATGSHPAGGGGAGFFPRNAIGLAPGNTTFDHRERPPGDSGGYPFYPEGSSVGFPKYSIGSNAGIVPKATAGEANTAVAGRDPLLEWLVTAHMESEKSKNMILSGLNQVAGRLQDEVSGMKGKVETVSGKVQDVNERLAEMDARVTAQLEVNMFKGTGARPKILPLLPLLFDTSTGYCGFIPVDFTDRRGKRQEVVVFSLAKIVRFFEEESPCKVNKEDVISFLTSSENFPRVPIPDYHDFIDLLLHTCFGFRAVGARWEGMKKENRQRFVVVPAPFVKKLLQDIDTHFPDRQRDRSEFTRESRMPNYKADGNAFGFMEASTSDKSTGKIVQIQQSISVDRKKLIPAMGHPWVKEWYTPLIQRFFDIPDEHFRNKHVVGSTIDIDSDVRVKTHAEAARGFSKRERERARERERKRKR